MEFLKYVLIGAVCLSCVTPTESWLFDDLLGKIILKEGCKILFGIACPVGLSVAGAAATVGSGGTATVAVAGGVASGYVACSAAKANCKRSVPTMVVLLPFSDEFSDYDTNGDKYITYEEFAFSVMSSVNMADPEELREPFIFSDVNGDEMLDTQEFKGAPFLFAHVNHSRNKSVPTVA